MPVYWGIGAIIASILLTYRMFLLSWNLYVFTNILLLIIGIPMVFLLILPLLSLLYFLLIVDLVGAEVATNDVHRQKHQR